MFPSPSNLSSTNASKASNSACIAASAPVLSSTSCFKASSNAFMLLVALDIAAAPICIFLTIISKASLTLAAPVTAALA